jgi:hypothetical protein
MQVWQLKGESGSCESKGASPQFLKQIARCMSWKHLCSMGANRHEWNSQTIKQPITCKSNCVVGLRVHEILVPLVTATACFVGPGLRSFDFSFLFCFRHGAQIQKSNSRCVPPNACALESECFVLTHPEVRPEYVNSQLLQHVYHPNESIVNVKQGAERVLQEEWPTSSYQ